MRPDLGDVERVVRGLLGIGFRHDLDLHAPFREIAALDRFVQVVLGAFAVVGDDGGGFLVGPVLDALPCFQMELHPVTLIARTDQAERVAAVAVYVAEADRQAAIGEQDGDLVQAFRRQRPEIPHGGGRAQVGPGMALLGVDEVGEFQRVADEEHRGVVADQVPVAFLGVELDREAAHVAFGIRRAAFGGDGGEAHLFRTNGLHPAATVSSPGDWARAIKIR